MLLSTPICCLLLRLPPLLVTVSCSWNWALSWPTTVLLADELQTGSLLPTCSICSVVLLPTCPRAVATQCVLGTTGALGEHLQCFCSKPSRSLDVRATCSSDCLSGLFSILEAVSMEDFEYKPVLSVCGVPPLTSLLPQSPDNLGSQTALCGKSD